MQNPPTTKEAYKAELIRRSAEGLFPCLNDEGNCVYRGPDGKECAAGILIPDDKYVASLEGKNAYNKAIHEVIQLPSDMSIDQVGQCQAAHDRQRLMERWDDVRFRMDIAEIFA